MNANKASVSSADRLPSPIFLSAVAVCPPVTCVALVLVPQRVGFRVYDLVGSRMLKSSSPHGAFLTDLTGYPPGSNAQNSATQFVQDENAHGKRADVRTGCTLVPPSECCERTNSWPPRLSSCLCSPYDHHKTHTHKPKQHTVAGWRLGIWFSFLKCSRMSSFDRFGGTGQGG